MMAYKFSFEFGNNNAFGSSARIPAIYELKKDNEADYEICKYIPAKKICLFLFAPRAQIT